MIFGEFRENFLLTTDLKKSLYNFRTSLRIINCLRLSTFLPPMVPILGEDRIFLKYQLENNISRLQEENIRIQIYEFRGYLAVSM